MARKKGALKGRLSIDLASTPHGGHPYGHAMDLETDPTPSTSSPTASSSPSPSASAPPPPIPPVAAEDADCPRVTAHIKWCMAHSYPRRAPLDVAVEANVPPPVLTQIRHHVQRVISQCHHAGTPALLGVAKAVRGQLASWVGYPRVNQVGDHGDHKGEEDEEVEMENGSLLFNDHDQDHVDVDEDDGETPWRRRDAGADAGTTRGGMLRGDGGMIHGTTTRSYSVTDLTALHLGSESDRTEPLESHDGSRHTVGDGLGGVAAALGGGLGLGLGPRHGDRRAVAAPTETTTTATTTTATTARMATEEAPLSDQRATATTVITTTSSPSPLRPPTANPYRAQRASADSRIGYGVGASLLGATAPVSSAPWVSLVALPSIWDVKDCARTIRAWCMKLKLTGRLWPHKNRLLVLFEGPAAVVTAGVRRLEKLGLTHNVRPYMGFLGPSLARRVCFSSFETVESPEHASVGTALKPVRLEHLADLGVGHESASVGGGGEGPSGMMKDRVGSMPVLSEWAEWAGGEQHTAATKAPQVSSSPFVSPGAARSQVTHGRKMNIDPQPVNHVGNHMTWSPQEGRSKARRFSIDERSPHLSLDLVREVKDLDDGR